MKKYVPDTILLFLQLFMFYIFPLSAGPTDTMGMVVLIILTTFVLSFFLGIISKTKLKFLYPLLISILFIPSVFIYYNESALIHTIWYLVISVLGLCFGSFINLIIKLIKK